MSPLHPPTADDAAKVARLMSEHWPEPVDEHRVHMDWTSPRIRLEHDARVGGDVYVLVESLDDGRAWIDLQGRAEPTALDWAEERALELGATRFWTGGWSTERLKLDELARRGYALIRRSWRMEIDLAGPPAPLVWPEGIRVRTVRLGEERTLYDVHTDVFRDTWGSFDESYEEWAHRLLDPQHHVPELWFLAVGGEEIAGYAICYPRPASPELGWVGILGVRRPWRRRGIGRALLLHAFHVFRAKGLARVGLGVDSESPTGAHTLYERAGMHATRTFEIYEKDVT